LTCFTQPLLTKPNGFRCLSFLPTAALVRFGIQQRNPHGLLTLGQIAVFGFVSNKRLHRVVVGKFLRLETWLNAGDLTRLNIPGTCVARVTIPPHTSAMDFKNEKPDGKQVSVRLTPSLYAAVAAAAREQDRSVSAQIRFLAAQALGEGARAA
jgi:hypothetical protein